jgi:hypothetical protein
VHGCKDAVLCCCAAVQNLRLKEQGLQSEVISQRGVRADTESMVKKMQFEIAELAGVIQDPKALKEKVGSAGCCYCCSCCTCCNIDVKCVGCKYSGSEDLKRRGVKYAIPVILLCR